MEIEKSLLALLQLLDEEDVLLLRKTLYYEALLLTKEKPIKESNLMYVLNSLLLVLLLAGFPSSVEKRYLIKISRTNPSLKMMKWFSRAEKDLLQFCVCPKWTN